MKIGFVSDTHGDEESLERAVSFMKDYDAIIHTGDVLSYGYNSPCFLTEYIKTLSNIYFVRGNGDYFDGMTLMNKSIDDFEKIFTFGNLKIFATHGFVHSIEHYKQKASDAKCQILVYGHTHIKKMEKVGDLILLNPGSTSRPRDGIKSFAYLEDDILKLYDLDTFEILNKMRVIY